ncbi:hypothetical protein JYU19_02370 [bacterium AH-315-J21]|nr:hypothetical protein [bacterium AH-315-J21]
MKYASRIQSAHRIVELKAIEEELKVKGAPSECYVISNDERFDGKLMDLSAALDSATGHGMGTIISCIPGKLAYFEGEESDDRYVLSK